MVLLSYQYCCCLDMYIAIIVRNTLYRYLQFYFFKVCVIFKNNFHTIQKTDELLCFFFPRFYICLKNNIGKCEMIISTTKKKLTGVGKTTPSFVKSSKLFALTCKFRNHLHFGRYFTPLWTITPYSTTSLRYLIIRRIFQPYLDIKSK